MQVIEVRAVPDDQQELVERVAALRPPGVVRSQVARNNVRADKCPRDRIHRDLAEVLSSRKVNGRIHLRRMLVEVGVEANGVWVWRAVGAGGVATIAIPYRIHQPAP